MDFDVVSYRGPGAAGGVSSGIERLWRACAPSNTNWWYINSNFLERLSCQYRSSQFVTMLPDSLVEGHYRYCNEFIWPLMHDLQEQVVFNPADRELYRQLNLQLADYIGYERQKGKRYFVQDYQLASLPRFTSLSGAQSIVFWHIPWPVNVQTPFIEPLSEIVRGLLRANVIGFHTAEYADNFMRFVCQYLPDYAVNSRRQIRCIAPGADGEKNAKLEAHGHYVLGLADRPRHAAINRGTQLVVQPLGIDMDFWSNLSGEVPIGVDMDTLLHKPFVISVDRADYTKSIAERLQMIELFFERYPHWRGTMSFMQVCNKTRAGIKNFDRYWENCRALYEQVNQRYATAEWQPVHWIEKSQTPAQLSFLYKQAAAMLVNPVRDGLNLTAKEFIACQGDDPGVLLLSPGAGAWHELGQFCLAADPTDLSAMADNVEQALSMPLEERKRRVSIMKEQMYAHQLSDWWNSIARFQPLPTERTKKVVPEQHHLKFGT